MGDYQVIDLLKMTKKTKSKGTCCCGRLPKRNGLNLLAVLPSEVTKLWEKKGYAIPQGKRGAMFRTFNFGKDGENGIYIVPLGAPVWADEDAFFEATYKASKLFEKAAKIGRRKQGKKKK